MSNGFFWAAYGLGFITGFTIAFVLALTVLLLLTEGSQNDGKGDATE